MSEAPARDALVRTLLPLVRKLARRLKRLVPSLDVDDLVGDGSVGLIRAVDSFDPMRGPQLAEYARRLIVGAMLNGIRRMDPVSERTRRLVRDGENQRYALAAARGDVPSAREMEVRCPGYGRAVAAAYRGQPLSLDAPLPRGESLAYDWSDDPARIVERRLQRAELAALLSGLPRRHREVLFLHYFNETSLRAVGRRLAISPQRAPRNCTPARSRSSSSKRMLRRIELDEPNAALPLQIGANPSEAVAPVVPDAELDTALLPHDQPRWVKDAVAVSQRAREIITRLRPAAVQVLSFWDHRIRAIVVAGERVAVDASGCYRAGS